MNTLSITIFKVDGIVFFNVTGFWGYPRKLG